MYRIGENTVGFSITTGDIFGEIPYVLGLVTSAMLVASSDQTVVRVISNKHLDKTLAKQPEIASRFYLFLARSLRSRFMSIQHSLLKEEESELSEVELEHPTKSIPDVEEDDEDTASPAVRSPSVETINAAPEKLMTRQRTRSFQGRIDTIPIPQSNKKSENQSTEPYKPPKLQLDVSGPKKRRSKSAEKITTSGPEESSGSSHRKKRKKVIAKMLPSPR